MEKSKKRSLVSGLAALALVLLLLYIVFRDKLPEIISALSEVSVPGVCLLLAMGLGYQLIDSAMCMTLLRSRLPEHPASDTLRAFGQRTLHCTDWRQENRRILATLSREESLCDI